MRKAFSLHSTQFRPRLLGIALNRVANEMRQAKLGMIGIKFFAEKFPCAGLIGIAVNWPEHNALRDGYGCGPSMANVGAVGHAVDGMRAAAVNDRCRSAKANSVAVRDTRQDEVIHCDFAPLRQNGVCCALANCQGVPSRLSKGGARCTRGSG
jgi:hypothetical protein